VESAAVCELKVPFISAVNYPTLIALIQATAFSPSKRSFIAFRDHTHARTHTHAHRHSGVPGTIWNALSD